MDRRITPRLETYRSVPVLFGLGVFIAAILSTVRVESDEIVLFAAVMVGHFATSYIRGGQSIRPWLYLIGRIVMGTIAVVWGVFILVERGASVTGLVGGTLLVVGVWLLLDTLTVTRTRNAHSLRLWRTHPIKQVRLQTIEAILQRASQPMTVSEIVDRCDLPEADVRSGLAVLLIAGSVAPRENGFVRRNIRIGAHFSGRDLIDRLGRPLQPGTTPS